MNYEDDDDVEERKSWKTSKSKYAEYFDIRPEENSATCLTCGAFLNMPNRSTSALKYHIENKHNIHLEESPLSRNNSSKMRDLKVVRKITPKSYRSMDKRANRISKYANYFDINENKAECLTCGAIIKCQGGTTNGMKYHAEKIHNIDFENEKNIEKNSVVVNNDDEDEDYNQDVDGNNISKSAGSTSGSPSKRKSKYAAYFDIKGNEAVCLTCEAVLKCSHGSKSGLKYHAEKMHNIQIEPADQDYHENFNVGSSKIKKSSKYAEYFDIRGSKAICLTCDAVIKISHGSTSGMKSHGERIHNINFREKKSSETILAPQKNSSYDDEPYYDENTDQNPWNILSLYEFLVFDCPSCDYKNNLKQEFINHVCEMHPEAVENLKNITDGSTSDISCPWEAETDFKFDVTTSEDHVDENYDTSLDVDNNETKIEIKSEMNIEEDDYGTITKYNEEDMIMSSTKEEASDGVQKKSKYLQYFTIEDNVAVCLQCDAILQCTNGSTSAMRYHGEKCHNIKFEDRTKNLLKVFSESVMDEKSPMKRSKYRQYFDIRGGVAVCLTCEAVVQCKDRTTSAMKYHAEKKHNIQLEDSATKANKLLQKFSQSTAEGGRKVSKYHKYYDMRGNVAKCLKCDAIIQCNDRSTSGLKSHAEKIHGIILDSTLLDSEGKIFVRPKPAFRKRRIKNSDKEGGICDLCGKPFGNLQKLKDHRRYCRKEKQRVYKKCEICNKTYTSLSLKSHIKAVHKKEKENICETCGKPFFSKSGLRMHMAVHFGNQVACDQCGKCYRDKTRLREHIKIAHEGRRDYPCSHCGKAFQTRKYQKMHEEIVHLGIKRHKCHLCSNAYGQSHELKSHYRRAHNLDPNLVKKKQKEEALEICKSKYPDV